MNETAARQFGLYNVCWYMRHHTDSKTHLQRNCRFWPEIHEIDQDGYFGKIYPIRPGTVQSQLNKYPSTLGWYNMEINIIEDGLVGPFDFTTINKQTHYVGKDQ
jgi:hypothetical protein